VVTGAPAPIGRDQAQQLARQELSKAIYHKPVSIPQAIIKAIESFLQRLFDTAGQATPGGWWTLIALAALAVIVGTAIVVRIGPVARSARRKDSLRRAGSRPLTASQYRDLAEASAAQGDYSTAILERLRAIATSMEERGILSPDAGRTADELAAQTAARFPAHRTELGAATRLFDQIRYGDGTGTAAGYERVRDLDDALAHRSTLAAAGA
jgi:hypothetical protein